ncbi:hypothetical protein O181_071661 [Austropuccinia psidii MF-1]|uniref:Uncharacterized protein n=1 Tax=Austropuccinia psidii MF-1 TaxID=1389203 RepID=A0A9Q3F154_9BASI|nr:hypothetical protein [Austropuccinia psidii MF-1]
MYQVYQTTGLLLDSIQHSKNMPVFGIQGEKKSMVEESNYPKVQRWYLDMAKYHVIGNERYSVDKDLYEWCLRQYKRLKAIDPQIKIQMRNHKLLTQMPTELDHAVKCRCNQN